MRKTKNLNQIYESCVREGMYIPQETISLERIQSLCEVAHEEILTIQELQNSKRYSTLYKLNYDVLHSLVVALLLFSNIKPQNHQCLYAYLCFHYKNFKFDFFERIRKNRNKLHYYGIMMNEEEWKKVYKTSKVVVKTLLFELKKKKKAIQTF